MYENDTERLRDDLKKKVLRLHYDMLGFALGFGLLAEWLWSWRGHRQGLRQWLLERGYQPLENGYWLVPEDDT